MNTMLSTTLALLIGTIITVNGIAVAADDLINEAKTVANKANIHQLATAIELYYSDHQTYPQVNGSEALIEKLTTEGYIMNQPLDSSVFNYQISDDGQNYSLSL